MFNFSLINSRKTFDTQIKEVARYRDTFNKNAIRCIRKYILKDPDETLPEARKHHNRLILADNIVRTIFWGTLAFYYCNWVISIAL